METLPYMYIGTHKALKCVNFYCSDDSILPYKIYKYRCNLHLSVIL